MNYLVKFFHSQTTKHMAILVFLNTIALIFYGSPALINPDESRYAEIAREMLQSGNYLIPHLQQIIYFEKPPLMYWLTSFSLSVFGISEWSARLVNPILSYISIFFFYYGLKQLFNSKNIAFYTVLILNSTFLFLIMQKYLNLDFSVGIFISISLLSYLLNLNQKSNSKTSNIWLANSFFFSFLAVMTKGLIGLILPMVVIGIYHLCKREFKKLINYKLYVGLFFVIVFSSIWIYLVNQSYNQFFNYYVIVQQFERYLTDAQNREMNKGIYILYIFAIFLPWTFFLPESLKKNYLAFKDNKYKNEILFLFIWFVAIASFFGFSQSILIGYLVPLLLPLCIFLSINFVEKFEANKRYCFYDYVIILLTISVFFIFALAGAILPFLEKFKIFFNQISTYLFPMAAILICIIIAIIKQMKKNNKKKVFAYILLGGLTISVLVWPSIEFINQKTVKPLIKNIESLIVKHPNNVVVVYGDYFYDASFYLNKSVILYNFLGELKATSKMKSSGVEKGEINSPQLSKLWNSNTHVFVITNKKDYNQANFPFNRSIYIVGSNQRYYILSNHPN